MAVFNRKHPSKVMATDEEETQGERTSVSTRKEKLMEGNTGKSSTLSSIMPGKTSVVAGVGTGGNTTVISGDTMFDGKIIAQGELRIDGTFKGEISSSNHVIVGTAGKVEATIEAKRITISGRVKGNLRIQERLELLSTGEICGDLETQPGALIIEQGATLEGRCTMGGSSKSAAAPVARSSQSAPAPAVAAQSVAKPLGEK